VEQGCKFAARIQGMGAGVESVKQELALGFGDSEIRERHDFETDSTVLSFQLDGVTYSVRVSRGR
jgi:hypothetical protein